MSFKKLNKTNEVYFYSFFSKKRVDGGINEKSQRKI